VFREIREYSRFFRFVATLSYQPVADARKPRGRLTQREREIEREKGTKTVRVNGVSIISSSTQLLLDCVDGRQRPLASALSAYLHRCQQKINIECHSAASRDHDVIETGL